ncbi:MAG: metal ABC transporter permease [Oscillospiraceae bacterium]|jgi:zinc transport system permease protein|nr:metal ABC transporter permease [Oscillospiraceae bacterium]
MNLIEMFSFDFMLRAFAVGALVALCSAMLGVTLTLKRFSMIGDGLSHVGFGALAFAAALNLAPLWVSIPVVVVAAFFLLRLSQNNHIGSESAIAIISSSALAIGVIVASLTGINTDLNTYLFGSILAISDIDMIFCVVLSAVVVVMFLLFYNKIFAVTFDEDFSKATGINTSLNKSIISILTALTIVVGMRVMGTLLISSLLVFPAVTANYLCKRFKTVVIFAAVLSLLCVFAGVVISYDFGTPTGATVVVINLTVFLCAFSIAKIRSKRKK